MQDSIGKIKVEINVSHQFMEDIICTALEGGITGWCHRAECVKGTRPGNPLADDYYTPEGFEWELYDEETGKRFSELKEDYPDYIPLTQQSFLDGFQCYLENHGSKYPDPDDASNYDASDASEIVQYAVFKEHIFC